MLGKLKEYWRSADAPTRKKRLISLAALGIFIVLSVVLFATVGRRLVRFVSDSEAFRAWIDARGFVGKLAYIGIVALQIVVAIIPGEPIELVAGYAFGAWQGLLLAEIGILISSAAVFMAVKKWGTRAVEAFIPLEKLRSFSFLQNDSRRNAIVFLIFFIPGTPKDVLTYFVGLTPMTLGQWLFITTVARIPSVISSTLTGAAVGDSRYLAAGVIYGCTALLSLAGALVYRKYMAKKEDKK
ncbi:MAG: TVP38/TMEM64 family protein [Clostridia bacterium]|nr:TVP38/TMEM64 family protein [Clostridia bacterium]MBQ4086519.1 TVP38/TMEM64 family protein [Clostridia bacterium]